MNYLKKLTRLIKKSKRIVIATHFNPDCDGIAAALCCGHLITHYKRRKPILFCYSPIPAKYRFLLGKWRFTRIRPSFDLLITVDAARISRIFAHMGHIKSARLDSKIVVNIDHHKSNDAFGELRIIRENASSTCEIIYDIFKKLKIKVNKPLAEIFYCGIYSDTGGFIFPNTNRQSLRVASELIKLGVQPGPLVRRLNARTLDATQLLSRVLNTITIKEGVGVMYLTQAMLADIRATMTDSENFVSFLQAIDGVRVALFFREEHRGTRVSLRSDGIIDVDELAQSFGGGGHRLAAGVKVRKDLNAAKREIVGAVLREVRLEKEGS